MKLDFNHFFYLFIFKEAYCTETRVELDYIIIFDEESHLNENCLKYSISKKVIIKNNNRNMFENTFILNKKSILDDINLIKNHYNHFVQLISSTGEFNSIEDEQLYYLKSDFYKKSNYEISLIFLNKTCIEYSDCLISQLNNYLISISQFNQNDAILFLIIGNQIQTKLIFDALFKFIYEISPNILTQYGDFDFIIFNNESLKFSERDTCDWFSNSVLNQLIINANKSTTRNYLDIRSLNYIQKENDFNFYEKFCSSFILTKQTEVLAKNYSFSNKFVSL